MKESDLYLPMKQWFVKQGYQVRPEIPMFFRSFDAVATKDNIVIAIEMKLSLTKTLYHQIIHGHSFADYSYVMIATKPNEESEALSRCLGQGIGVLSYKDQVLLQLYPAKRNEKYAAIYHQRAIDLVKVIEDSDAIGGKPNLKGVGPAQTVKRLINSYLKKTPGATWKALYRDIPNHYSSYRSMQGAMYLLSQRIGRQNEIDEVKRGEVKE